MPRKLKTYQTSLGFFDLAVSATSMKAALEAWGSKTNLFHQGFASEANDPAIVAATMAKPGVVLRRAVGSNGSFKRTCRAPQSPDRRHRVWGAGKRGRQSRAAPAREDDDKAAQAAAVAYAREQKRRESERHRQEAAQELERKRRAQAMAKAEAALEEAKQIHDTKIAEIAAARSALDRQTEAEETRWAKQRAKLEAALGQARD